MVNQTEGGGLQHLQFLDICCPSLQLPVLCGVRAFVAFSCIYIALLSHMCLAVLWESARLLFQLFFLVIRKVISALRAGKYLFVCC